MKKLSLLILIALVLAVPFAHADDEEETAPIRVEEKTSNAAYFNGVAEKFGRGISNVALSAFEIPYRIGREFETTNPFAALTAGSLKGIGWGGARLFAGVYDVLTFPVPSDPVIGDFDAGWWSA